LTSRYTSQHFQELLTENGVTCSMSRSGNRKISTELSPENGIIGVIAMTLDHLPINGSRNGFYLPMGQ